MATIREIVNKAVELNGAIEKLEALQQDRQLANQRVADVDALIAPQQAIVVTLRSELKAML